MKKKILERYPEEVFLFADGFDDAIIGIEDKSKRIIYSVNSIIDILSKSMERCDAIEHFYFNIEGSYVGEKTPIYCEDAF